jgi:large conductance mechanosensitive channel
MAVGRRASAARGFLAEFQAFLLQGNVVDLAVAVIIGGAFGKIVDSFVKDIITPAILSPVLTSLNLKNLEDLSLNGIKYGLFLSNVISFIVIAFSIFVMIRIFDQFKRKEAAAEEAAPPPPLDPAVETQQQLNLTLERLTQVLESQVK